MFRVVTYKEEPRHVVQSFKYLGINVSSTNTWNLGYESGLQEGWNGYHMFENQCSQSNIQGWEVRLMLFNVTQWYKCCFMEWKCGVAHFT